MEEIQQQQHKKTHTKKKRLSTEKQKKTKNGEKGVAPGIGFPDTSPQGPPPWMDTEATQPSRPIIVRGAFHI